VKSISISRTVVVLEQAGPGTSILRNPPVPRRHPIQVRDIVQAPQHPPIALRPNRGELQKKLAQIAANFGFALKASQIKGHPIPIYTHKESISTARVLLVGDAAGLVDPFSGEGIRFAIKSGQLAAQALLADQPSSYPVGVHKQIGFSLQLGLAVAWFFYRFPGLSLALGIPSQVVTQAFMDMLGDRISYWGFAFRMIVGSPLILINKARQILAF